MPIFSGEYPQKNTPVDDDKVLIADSENLNAIKATKISSIITRAVNAVKALTDWVTTAMIQNGAVTSQKIAWETLYKTSDFMSAQSSLTVAGKTGATVTVPAGVSGELDISAVFELNNLGASRASYYGAVFKNGVSTGVIVYTDGPASSYFLNIPVIGRVSVVPGDVITFVAGREGGTGGNLGSRSRYSMRIV